MWFFEWWPHIISHQTVKFGVHRCANLVYLWIGDITFFLYHETIYDHVMKELCDFVRRSSISSAINLSILVEISHVEIKVNVQCDCCVWWPFPISHNLVKGSGARPCRIRNKTFLFVTWPNVIKSLKVHLTLNFVAPYYKIASCDVWWPQVSYFLFHAT